MNNHHQNVRTTFYSRALIVQRVLKEGKSVRGVAEALGVSRHTVYKWLARYRAGGRDALYGRSSRPRRLPVGRVATIAAMRRMGLGSPRIVFCLSMPLSTVTFEPRCLGLNRLPPLEHRPPAIQYKHRAPGEMIHLDIKKLGKETGWGTASMGANHVARGAQAGSICTFA